MNKEFVTYEQARALKELGFDEPCYKYVYLGDTGINVDHYLEVDPSKAKNYNEDNLCISQPTYSAAFRWFRKKDYYSEVRVGCTQIDGSIGYEWWVWKPNRIEEWSPEVPGEEWSYETYEEAEQACLDKLIEIVKNNAHI